jgi:gas vesicle protein
MGQKDGFAGGFILGSILGGVIGGVIGTLVAAKTNKNLEGESEKRLLKNNSEPRFNEEENIEVAKRSLEDKIAQLNSAIDDVRQQLGSVHTNKLDG